MLLEFRKLDDDLILAGKLSDSSHNLEGISQIHTKDAVEKSDDKTETDVIREPEKPFQDFRMNQKVVNRAQKPPVKSELRTDDSLDVAPVFGIIPKPDFHADNKNHSGNVFKERDAESHESKQNGLLQMRI